VKEKLFLDGYDNFGEDIIKEPQRFFD